MNKQIQSASRHYGSISGDTVAGVATQKYKEVETEDGSWTSSTSTPEISIVPAEGEEGSLGDVEIDSCTGLPKLPVEPLPPNSPDYTSRKLSSALKMSTASSPGNKRKSVTFGGTEHETGGAEADSKSGMSKVKSTGSVVVRDGQTKRANGRPTSLPNRSRSVLIRLQPPKGTPTLPTHKRIIGKSDSLPHGGLEEAKFQDSHYHQSKMPEHQDSTAPRILDTDEAIGSDSPVFSSDVPVHPGSCRWNNQDFGRRSSFLYMSDAGDYRDDYANSATYMGGEDFVTPFAQILSTLHRVRSEYLMLMGLSEDTKTSYTRAAWSQAPAPLPYIPPLQPDQKDPIREKMALDVLEELDWSLKTLETVNASQSMGNMTGAKFKRLLNRELSHLSEGSEKGAQVAAWVTNITNPDPYDVDKALGTMYTERTEGRSTRTHESSLSLSASLSHDNWTRHRRLEERGRKVTIEAESIPTYGIDVPGMDKAQMREYMETKLYEWEVDAFHFDTVSGGNPLVSAAYILFKRRNFFSEFQISPHVFINYMTAIQASYHAANPYHNAIHAADVLLTTNKLMSADNLECVFTGVEVMAALVAAAVHDVEHPGVTNQFLVAIRHDLAIMYNDISVLENHHVATAFRTLQKPNCNFIQNLDTECVQLFRKVVIDMVLSTDMGRHIQNVAEMKTLMETKKLTNDGMLSLDNYAESSAVLKCLIHCADLSNPMKPPAIAAQWSYRIMEENFKQGDREKELQIPVHAMGDRDVVAIPKCQISFIDFIVYPLWETWAELVYPHAQRPLDNITTTKNYWCSIASDNDSSEDHPEKPILCNRDSSSDEDSETNDMVARDVNILSSPPTKRSSSHKGEAKREDVPRPVKPSAAAVAQSHSGHTPSGGGSSVGKSGRGSISTGTRSSSADDASTTRSQDDSVNLAGSADSATLQAAFVDSPANQRRSSFKTFKQIAVVSSSVQD